MEKKDIPTEKEGRAEWFCYFFCFGMVHVQWKIITIQDVSLIVGCEMDKVARNDAGVSESAAHRPK